MRELMTQSLVGRIESNLAKNKYIDRSIAMCQNEGRSSTGHGRRKATSNPNRTKENLVLYTTNVTFTAADIVWARALVSVRATVASCDAIPIVAYMEVLLYV